MSAKQLGDYFDIHRGGEDHISVHQNNEIAQSEARYGTRLANFWLHGVFLKSDNDKMSKSSVFVRLQTLIERGIDPLAYRYLCLTTHYRSQMNFTEDALNSAASGLERIRMLVYRLGAPKAPDDGFIARFQSELNHDLNFPRALAAAWELLKCDLPDGVKKATMLKFDETFGLLLATWQPVAVSIPPALADLLAQRELARNERRWGGADRLREQARKIGYELDDTAQGQQVRHI